MDKKIHYLTFDLEAKVTQIVAQATVKYTFPICTCKVEAATCTSNSLGADTKLYQKWNRRRMDFGFYGVQN